MSNQGIKGSRDRGTEGARVGSPKAPGAIVGILLALYVVAGCAQNQDTISEQPSLQGAAGAVEATAQSAQDGPRQALIVVTNPHGRGAWSADGHEDLTDPGETADGPPVGEIRITAIAPPGARHNWSVKIDNITQTITSDVAGTQTQTPTGSVSPAQTSSSTATGGAMTQEPRSSAAVPITVSAAPGSTAQGGPTSAVQGAGAAGGTQTATQTAEAWAAELKAVGDRVAALERLLTALRQPAAGATTQPAGAGDGS